MDFIKKAFIRIITAGTGLQVFSFLLGIYDETYSYIVKHRVLVVGIIIEHTFLHWIIYDAELAAQKLKYSERLKGASIRQRRKRSKETKNK